MISPEQLTHESALQLLPWLVNGSLSGNEASAAREHALNCVICRRELESLELFQDQFSLASETVSAPAPDMRNINRRIDELIEQQNSWQDAFVRVQEFARSPWRLAFVAQSIALLVLAGMILVPNPPEAEFTTLSNPTAAAPVDFVRVVFSPDLDELALSELLNEYGLTVISGPTERGVYTLSSDALDREQLVESLQSRTEVLFAQPVVSGR
jgi:hypothetical protein